MFDMDGDEIKTATSWFQDGFLVFDKNRNSNIDNGTELFSEFFIKADGNLAKDGIDALKSLDSNNDGFLNALDKDFNNLKIWIDENSDGISQTNEMKSLYEVGVLEFNLTKKINYKITMGQVARSLSILLKKMVKAPKAIMLILILKIFIQSLLTS